MDGEAYLFSTCIVVSNRCLLESKCGLVASALTSTPPNIIFPFYVFFLLVLFSIHNAKVSKQQFFFSFEISNL